MTRRNCLGSVIVVVGLLLGTGTPCRALEGLLAGRQAAEPPAPREGGYGQSAGTPGPQRYPVYAAGNYPWYGYGFGVPTYNWGYFGVRYREAKNAHTGYYGDYYQWGYRRGY